MKILLLDIETSPNTAYVWSLWKENIPLARLIESSEVMCYSAKFFGEEGVYFDSIYRSKTKNMLNGIHSLLDEADVVIHYNGKQFDIPCLNKEFLIYGMEPPSGYKQIDLLTTVRSQFRFTSNKLDYVSQRLGLGKKHETDFQLWVDCMKRDSEAWKRMESYNIQDVLLLEKLYEKLRPWVKGHPNIGLYTEVSCCPTCGTNRIKKDGHYYTSTRRYQRYRCKECKASFRDKSNNYSVENYVSL